MDWSIENYLKLQVILLLAVPRLIFCFGSLVVLDVVLGYALLFLSDIKRETRKKIKIIEYFIISIVGPLWAYTTHIDIQIYTKCNLHILIIQCYIIYHRQLRSF